MAGISVFAEDEDPVSDLSGMEATDTTDANEDGIVDDIDMEPAEDSVSGDVEEPESGDEDGYLEIMPISAPIEPVASEFYDVAGHWAESSIEFVVRNGVFTGVGDGRFDPNGILTRGMLVTILGRYDGAQTWGYSSSFTDVGADLYYAPFVAWAEKNNIVLGTSEATFEPDAFVTREQAAKIILAYINYSSKIPRSTRVYRTPFTDVDSISDWALSDVRTLQDYELITGRADGSFDPQGKLTRAEASVIMKRFIENGPVSRLEI
jgi:hypothetical protein